MPQNSDFWMQTFDCPPDNISIIFRCPELILVVPGERTTTISNAGCKYSCLVFSGMFEMVLRGDNCMRLAHWP